MQPDLDDEQGTEGPKEDAQEMLADDVLPHVFLDDMLRGRGDEPHDEEAGDGVDEVYPVLVKNIELGVASFSCFMLMFVFQHTES